MIKSGYNNTSKSESWNVLETVMSHLKESIDRSVQFYVPYIWIVKASTLEKLMDCSVDWVPLTYEFHLRKLALEETLGNS